MLGDELAVQLREARTSIPDHVATFAKTTENLDETLKVQEYAFTGRPKAAWIESTQGKETVFAVRGLVVTCLPCPRESGSP